MTDRWVSGWEDRLIIATESGILGYLSYFLYVLPNSEAPSPGNSLWSQQSLAVPPQKHSNTKGLYVISVRLLQDLEGAINSAFPALHVL